MSDLTYLEERILEAEEEEMGQRIIDDRPLPSIVAIPWHDKPYGAKDNCWGCGLEPDTTVHYSGMIMFHRTPNPRYDVLVCQWCADLTECLVKGTT